MRERLILTFLFHMFSLSLLLIPVRFKGPLLAAISGIRLRVLDVTAIIMILAGTVFLFTYLFSCFKAQMKQASKLSSENSLEKTE